MFLHLIKNNFRVFQCHKLFVSQFSGSASANSKDSQNLTILTNDGKLIVSWHPAKDFPYECSKPLPEMKPEIAEGDSLLKIQYRLDEANREPNAYQYGEKKRLALMELTYTSKHNWFPKAKRQLYKRARNAIPWDREGL